MKFREWLEYVKLHTRVDLETGDVYWAIRMKGRRVNKPIGCLDSNGYIKTQVAGRACYCHQLVLFHVTGIWPALVDHENKNRSDNRPNNLRPSNYSKNALNSKTWSSNTTGVKGVSQTKGRFKVTVKGKHYGYFDTLAQAKEVADGCYN